VVEDGLAESFARRGKNVTGISGYTSTELWSKLLQLLKEAKPDIKRIHSVDLCSNRGDRVEVRPQFARLVLLVTRRAFRNRGRSSFRGRGL
jgi:hypothetical protein